MSAAAKQCVMAFSFVILLLAFTGDRVLATPTVDTYTIDAKNDAGTAFGQPAYAQFLGGDGRIYPVSSGDFAGSPATLDDIRRLALKVIPENVGWIRVQSAGNIWSTQTNVGDFHSYPAGTYRIDAVSGGFTYDSFNWSSFNDDQWFMKIRVQENSGAFEDKTLGNFLPADVGKLPLYAYVTLKGPGWLGFWIDDWNSIDNKGSLTFSVTSVPAPPSILLLAGGLPFLVPRVRKFLGYL